MALLYKFLLLVCVEGLSNVYDNRLQKTNYFTISDGKRFTQQRAVEVFFIEYLVSDIP